MADTILATYGAAGFNTPPFEYCGFRAGSIGPFFDIVDWDVIRVWINQCTGSESDVAHVTIVGHSDAGDPSEQFVWQCQPTGTYITHFGDEDGGSGDLFGNGFTTYYEIRVGSTADLSYCLTVTWDYCDPDLPLWPFPDEDEDWHVGGPHF